jgi:hypothetical protein
MAVSGMLSQMRIHEAARVQGGLASPYLETALWARVGVVLFRCSESLRGNSRERAEWRPTRRAPLRERRADTLVRPYRD